MRIGLIIYGSLETLSGGYLYDRKLVEYLRSQGDTVEVISLPWRNYAAHLMDNWWFRLPSPSVIASHVAATLDLLSKSPGAHLSWRTVRFAKQIGSAGEQSPTQQKFDILIQDELNHPSLIAANAGKHHYPIISLVHHLRCSELRPKWQNAFYRWVEKKYLKSVDGFIFNSQTTQNAVNSLLVNSKPSITAYPPTDRFGEAISEGEIIERAKSEELRILFLGNVIYRKGLHTLLKAISLQPTAFRLDVVGSLDSEPEYAKQMQEFITANNFSSFVFYHGPLDKEPLIEKLKRAHVLVVPSSYEALASSISKGWVSVCPQLGQRRGRRARSSVRELTDS